MARSLHVEAAHALARWIRPAALCCLALTAAACGDSERDQGSTRSLEQTAIVAYSYDIIGVNELTSGATPIQTALLYFGLFATLVDEQADYEQGPPTFAPRLAESYEFSGDHKVLTFHLRKDVTWSDGVPITAEDVHWTWQAQTHPDVAWSFADAKRRIENVEVVDPHTVRFHFSEVYANQLLDANQGVILPKHAWSQLPFDQWRGNNDWFLDHLVVSGPFTLESWEPQQRYVLRRNESYYETGFPKIDRIVFQIIPEPASQLAMLRSGQAHFVEFVAPSDAHLVENDSDLRLESFLARYFFVIQWNVSRPLFAEREVRQALAMGIDRQAITDSLYHGYAAPSYSPFTTNVWAHHKGLEPWPYDPVRAREILARHGWTDSDGDGILDRDGKPFRFELVTNTGNKVRMDLMLMVKEQLKLVGVEVDIRAMEFTALLVPLRNHDFDAVVAAFAMDTSLNTYHYFHSRAIDDGYNWGVYSNPEVDRLIENIEQQVDQLAAKPLYDRLQEVLHEDQPGVFLYESRRLSGIRNTLRDVDPNAISSFFHLRRWRLVDPGRVGRGGPLGDSNAQLREPPARLLGPAAVSGTKRHFLLHPHRSRRAEPPVREPPHLGRAA